MRKNVSLWLCLILLGAICSVQAASQGSSPGEEFIGTWSGTWEGNGSGGFELTLG